MLIGTRAMKEKPKLSETRVSVVLQTRRREIPLLKEATRKEYPQ